MNLSPARFQRWLRTPKGLFAGVLTLLTAPAAIHGGWALVLPGLIAAVLVAVILDAPLLRWRDGAWSVPDGAMLTGWLVALVLSPHVPYTIAAATAAVGIVAKHALRVKRANVLNPAAAALVASYYLFDSGQNWWGALPELPSPWIALVVLTALFMSSRLHKLPLALSFLGAHFLLGTIAAYAGDAARVAELYRAPDVHMALFFAGFMATDPPTSPPKAGDQVRFGVIAAVASFALFMLVGAVYFLLGGLLVANLWEGWRKWRRVQRPARSTPTLAKAVMPAAALLLMGTSTVARPQRFRTFVEPNVAYDGRFTFVRLRYTERGPNGWAFDYPAMERNFMTIVQDLTTLRPHVARSNVHRMDDALLSRYPVAYLSEPGYWYPDDDEAVGLRRWLQKGGFLIVDDFYLRQWEVFARAMRTVLPNAQFIRLDRSHPVFNAFFRIESLDGMHHPSSRNARAEYYGVFEDNDPSKRLMVIVNYNNDIGDYMEWSGQGWYAVNLSNDAYKFATNYLVYALTH